MSPAPNEPIDGLTVKLPAATTISEFTVTRAGLSRVLDAATAIYLRNIPQDDASVTLHLAMKTAARMLLWYVAKKSPPGTEVPHLTRRDDAVAVVIRYMLESMFGEAIRRSGGVIDAGAAPDAIAAQAQHRGEYGELAAALAGLVSGPVAESPRDDVSPRGSAAQTLGDADATSGATTTDAA